MSKTTWRQTRLKITPSKKKKNQCRRCVFFRYKGFARTSRRDAARRTSGARLPARPPPACPQNLPYPRVKETKGQTAKAEQTKLPCQNYSRGQRGGRGNSRKLERVIPPAGQATLPIIGEFSLRPKQLRGGNISRRCTRPKNACLPTSPPPRAIAYTLEKKRKHAHS